MPGAIIREINLLGGISSKRLTILSHLVTRPNSALRSKKECQE